MKRQSTSSPFRIARLTVLLVLGVASAPALFALDAVVSAIDGKVEVRMTADGPWEAVSEGQAVPVGATISTSFSATAELTIGESTVQVEPLTRMRIDQLVEDTDTDRSGLHLQVGRVNARVRSREGRETSFRVSSPIAVAAVRGTDFSFDGANLQVDDGVVALANRYQETVSVGAGESSSTTGDTPPATPQEQSESDATVTVSTDPEAGPGEGESGGGSSTGTGNLTINWTFQ